MIGCVTLHTSDYIALCSVLVSAAAVFIYFKAWRVSIDALNENRKLIEIQNRHNILSVKPIMNVGHFDYENSINVTLRNVGMGPAYIKRITITNNINEEKNTLLDWMPDLQPGITYSFYASVYKDFWFRPQVESSLLKLDAKKTTDSDGLTQAFKKSREDVRKTLKDLTVKVIYTDMYESEDFTYSFNLDYFGRIDNEIK